MSFSLDVKNEIMQTLPSPANRSALLCGAILGSGSLVINGSGVSFIVVSENPNFIEFFKKLLLADYPGAETQERQENINFKQKTRIELSVDSSVGRRVLTDLGILSFNKDSSFVISRVGQRHLTIEDEGKLEFIKGFFLGAGSVSIPEAVDVNNLSKNSRSSGYHLEFSVESRQQAELIADILAGMDIIAGLVQRNEGYVVYLKEAESISILLSHFKAYKSVLRLENERAGREMRNLVNRQANCISANIDKSINAALIQLDAIDKISQTIGIEALDEPLREVCYARLNNPEGSLKDILEVLPTKISKGALSQRFKRIIELSKEV